MPVDANDNTSENNGSSPVSDAKNTNVSNSKVIGYPASWAEGFGDDYYMRQNSLVSMLQPSHLPLIIPTEPGIYNPNPEINIPSSDQIAGKIEIVMKDITGEDVVNE